MVNFNVDPDVSSCRTTCATRDFFTKASDECGQAIDTNMIQAIMITANVDFMNTHSVCVPGILILQCNYKSNQINAGGTLMFLFIQVAGFHENRLIFYSLKILIKARSRLVGI